MNGIRRKGSTCPRFMSIEEHMAAATTGISCICLKRIIYIYIYLIHRYIYIYIIRVYIYTYIHITLSGFVLWV